MSGQRKSGEVLRIIKERIDLEDKSSVAAPAFLLQINIRFYITIMFLKNKQCWY